MDAKLEQYRIFNVAAGSKSVSQAAQKLYMTQSAVSQAIKQLEDTLDTKLFIRSSRGIKLTREGETLYEYTLSAIELIETGTRKLTAFRTLEEGEIKIGASDTVSFYYLTPLLESYHRAYPNIKIRVVNRVTREAIDLLKSGTIDLAFGNLPITDASLEIAECLKVHDVFVAGNGFEHLRGKTLSRREIACLPLILLEKKSNSRNYVDEVFARSGCSLGATIELGAHELLLQFASINLGVSCVIREFSQKYIESGAVFELKQKSPVPARAIGCCYSKHITLSSAAQKFVQMMTQTDNID